MSDDTSNSPDENDDGICVLPGDEGAVIQQASTDVTTDSKFQRFSSNPLGFFIRLGAESTAFVQGDGWQGYNNPIGQPIFYPEYSREIREALMESARLKETVHTLALRKVAQDSEKNASGAAAAVASADGEGDDPAHHHRPNKSLKRAEKELWNQTGSVIDGMIANLDSINELKLSF
ncbi:hypothetical protein HDU98_011537 [Podochytrium sp. JEL0797]|nr:hypothetical protein HDU98_011537 [Podochytrium sp. JEL0797]